MDSEKLPEYNNHPYVIEALKFARDMLKQPVFGCTGTSSASAARIMRSDACHVVMVIDNALRSAGVQ
jgi:hypothetical protein